MGRLRFKPWAQEYLNNSKYFVDVKEFNQDTFFPTQQRPLYLEIGHGKGKFIINFAKMEPKINFIGIEKFASVQVYAVKKIQDKNFDNIVFLLADAVQIDEFIKKESVDKIFINFPDPWPKEKHSKRRLLYKNYLEKYYYILKEKGIIELKTDNLNFFNFAKEEVSKMDKWENCSDIESKYDENITTEYEEKFLNLNKEIFYLKIQKK